MFTTLHAGIRVKQTHSHARSLEKRGVGRASILGIPLDSTPLLSIDKQTARRKLGIPEKAKVIFSSGQAHKYDPIGEPNFYQIVSDVVNRDPSIVFYIAGANARQIFWPELKKRFPYNLILTGALNYATEYPLYLASADLVLDSYPVGGEPSIIDAVKAGKPVLTLNVNIQADYLINSKSCCRSYAEFLAKIHLLLNNKDYADELYQDVHRNFQLEADVEVWHGKCNDIFARLPKTHRVCSFQRSPLNYPITPFSLETCRWTERDLSWRKALRKIRRALVQVRWKKEEKVVRILGFYLFNKRETLGFL